jgi:plasmid replication initiation protein
MKRSGKLKGSRKDKGTLVVRHNRLIESKHFLTLSERRFLFWIISRIQWNDEELKTHTITVQEWEKLVGLEPTKNTYNEVYKMADSLTQRNVKIKDRDGNGWLDFTPWFHRIRYKQNEGKIEAILHPDLKPFLLQLKEQYTAIALEYALLLRGGYSYRIYDLLKQYQSVGSRTILLSDLREMLEIKKQEYPLYADFRKRVLEAAQKEINAKTDISFTFQPIKEGRKITAIFFEIQTTKPVVTLENQEEADPRAHALFQALIRHGVAEKNAREFIADYDMERIEWHVKEYEKRKKANKAENTGWLVQGIKEDYRPQSSLYEQEEEKKRERAKAEREHREKLDAEIDRLKKECDEHNHQSGRIFLSGLPEEERGKLDQEFLQKYGSLPGISGRFRKDGLESPLTLKLYLIFLREKYPKVALSYRDYAKKKGAAKEILTALSD